MRLFLAMFTASLLGVAMFMPGSPGLAAQTFGGGEPDRIDADAPESSRGGGVRIALQAGHWLSEDVPDELARLRTNGTRGGGRYEWEVALEIAERTARKLRSLGYEVEILPATVPPGYRTDLFIAIHADGFHSPSASGFSVAAPRRDATGRAAAFAEVLAGTYGEATALRQRAATRTMRGYYAFNSRRYVHSVDPSTVGVIIETGFLTSPRDREILLGDPDRSARGIADAVSRFLPIAAPVVEEADGMTGDPAAADSPSPAAQGSGSGTIR